MRLVAVVLIVLIVVGGLAAAGHAMATRGEPVVQPIAFNHAVHLNEAGLECLACHTDAETDVYAGLPGKAICLDCHDIDEEQDDPNPEKAKLFAFADLDEDIPWKRVAVTKPDVFFSHRRHVTSAGLDCLQCHVDQPTLVAPPPRVRVVMRMTACIACHKKNGASADCIVCHR